MRNRTKVLVALFAAVLGGAVGIENLSLWNVLCYYKTPGEVCAAYFSSSLYMATAFLSGLLVFFAVFYAINALFAFYRKNIEGTALRHA